MRAKRTRARPTAAPDREKPPDATGATIDWIGVQETGGGGQLLPVWFVGGLAALRAAPFVAWRISRRLARIGRGGIRPGEPQKRP
jgi:hypothetical protein